MAAASAANAKPLEAGPDVARQEPRVRLVGLVDGRVEAEGHDAGDDDDERQDHLEAARERQPALSLLQRLARQRPLDDVLVAAPVEQVGHPHAAQEHAEARQQLVGVLARARVVGVDQLARAQDHVEAVRQVLHQLDEARQHAAAGPVGRAVGVERQHGREQSAADEHDHLHHVGPGDGLQAAVDRVDGREDGQPGDPPEQRHAHDALQRESAEVEDRRQVDEHVDQEPEHGQERPHAAVVALLQELRHRKDAFFEVDREEEVGDHQERHRRHPLVAGDGQAQAEARAGHSDKLLGRDVRRDQRGADGPPRERLAGQEVVLGVLDVALLLARDPEADADDEGCVGGENDVVDRGEVHAGGVRG